MLVVYPFLRLGQILQSTNIQSSLSNFYSTEPFISSSERLKESLDVVQKAWKRLKNRLIKKAFLNGNSCRCKNQRPRNNRSEWNVLQESGSLFLCSLSFLKLSQNSFTILIIPYSLLIAKVYSHEVVQCYRRGPECACERFWTWLSSSKEKLEWRCILVLNEMLVLSFPTCCCYVSAFTWTWIFISLNKHTSFQSRSQKKANVWA